MRGRRDASRQCQGRSTKGRYGAPITRGGRSGGSGRSRDCMGNFFRFTSENASRFNIVRSMEVLRIFQRILLRLLRTFVCHVNCLCVINAQLKSCGSSRRKCAVRLRMTFSINETRFNSSSVARASSTIILFFSSRIIRLFYDIRRSRDASNGFYYVSFSAA